MFGQFPEGVSPKLAPAPMTFEEALASQQLYSLRTPEPTISVGGCCSACPPDVMCITACAPCPEEPREPVEQGTTIDQGVIQLTEQPAIMKLDEQPALEMALAPKKKIPTPVIVGGAAALAWMLLGG